ncbi:MAG TPA: DUF4286 family protein [Flavisolibacter sp.]|nr:DUF4286 family protein [Flavisolibacter sp.]
MAEAIIYNVTVKVEAGIAEAWLKWLQGEHIPDIMRTGCFTDSKVVRLLEVDDSEGPTYAIQYSAPSKADYNRYISLHSSQMQQKSYQKWGDRFIAFRSVMQVVS